MKLLTAMIIMSITVVCSANPNAQPWSLLYLARASNSLLVANDQIADGKSAICRLSKTQASTATANLHVLIDEKIKTLQLPQHKKIEKQAVKCLQTCSCDIFSYYFDKSASIINNKIKSTVDELAKSTTPKIRAECAKNFQEFCSSELFKKLIQ